MDDKCEIGKNAGRSCDARALLRGVFTTASVILPMICAIAACKAQDAPTTASSQWVPLVSSKFSQEAFEPWIPVPSGSSGAPRQGWVNTDDGFFTREVHLAYDHTDLNTGAANETLARFNYPLSRRFWVGLEVPFYEQTHSRGAREAEGVGDSTLTTKVMLTETRDLSVNAGVAWELPWGNRRVGGGQFGAEPQVSIWKDVGRGVSIRGGTGYDFVASRSLANSFVLNAAIGQTITAHDQAIFGDLTYYVSGNYRAPNHGPAFFSLTPGMRTHLGGNLFFLAGVEVPVANRNENFRTCAATIRMRQQRQSR